MFGGRRFQQRSINLYLHVPWKEPIENLLRRLFKDVIGLLFTFFQITAAERQYFFNDEPLLDDGLEFVIDDVHRVDFRGGVSLHNSFGNILGMAVIKPGENIHEFGSNVTGAASEEIPAFTADRHKLDCL